MEIVLQILSIGNVIGTGRFFSSFFGNYRKENVNRDELIDWLFGKIQLVLNDRDE
jgi:hypothetical protein